MKQIVFITSTISQPRVIKRIESLYKAGFSIKVYGFSRNVYNCNTLPEYCNLELLGNMKDGSGYLSKIQKFKNSIDFIVKKHEEDNIIFYSFSLISSYFLMKKKVKYVYELSDLLYGYPRFNLVRPFFKYLDKRIINNSLLTVMTSTGFKNYLFPVKSNKNIIIQPNKLSPYFLDYTRPRAIAIDKNHIRFGFVGAIRYKETILRFAKIIGKHYPNHEFHFYGVSAVVGVFQEESKDFKNVVFHGAFKNPTDLDLIYSNIDIIVACYETGSLNERIAEPNKLYEAIYFEKPIVVSNNSFLANQVKSNKCGYSINAYNDNSIIEFINSLTPQQINSIQNNEESITTEELIDNPSHIISYLRNH